MKQEKGFIKAIIALVVAFALCIGIFILASVLEERVFSENIENANLPLSLMEDECKEENCVVFNGQEYQRNKNVVSLLVIGIDDYTITSDSDAYNNSGQADFLMLILLDRANNTYSLLHLNRDTIAKITILGVGGQPAGATNGQLALAHAYGSGGEDSCKNTRLAVSDLLFGVEIDYYLSMTMDAVGKLNDLVGGITLEVLDDFADNPQLIKGASVTLTGDLALQYVRGRTGVDDGSNLSRMKRQQQYLELFFAALKERSKQDETFALSAFNAISEYIITDLEVDELSMFFNDVGDYAYSGMHTPEGVARMGPDFMEYYVDDDLLKQLVVDLFYLPMPEQEE